MRESVFISGSMNISHLDDNVKRSFDRIIDHNLPVLVGDAPGIDTLVQEYFNSRNYYNVTVYSIFHSPRNLASSNFTIKKIDPKQYKGRKAQEEKDKAMTNDSSYSFVIWNGKSKGSLNNILRSLEKNQKLKVYYLPQKRFLMKEELSKNNIMKLYYQHNGIGFRELTQLIGVSPSLVKKIIQQYPEYKLSLQYRGKEYVKYSYEIVDKIKENLLLYETL